MRCCLSVYIPEKFREAARELSLSEEGKARVADSKQMGKLKFFPVVFDICSDEQLKDLHMLADFRKTIQ